MLGSGNFGLYVQSKSNLLIRLKKIWLCRSKNLEREKRLIYKRGGFVRIFNLWYDGKHAKKNHFYAPKSCPQRTGNFPQINWQFHQTNHLCPIWPKNSPVQLLVGFFFNWRLWSSLWLAQTCSPVFHHHHRCQYHHDHHLMVVTLYMSKHGGIVLAPSSLEARSKNPEQWDIIQIIKICCLCGSLSHLCGVKKEVFLRDLRRDFEELLQLFQTHPRLLDEPDMSDDQDAESSQATYMYIRSLFAILSCRSVLNFLNLSTFCETKFHPSSSAI